MVNSLAPDEQYYFQTRREVAEHVPGSVRRLLDIGCGGGAFAQGLKKRQPVEIWGVEINDKVAVQASGIVDRVLVGDIMKIVPELPDGYFDCIICNDVLEHLYDPYTLLARLRSKFAAPGLLICSIPNIRYFKVLKSLLLRKEWEYTDSGIMDFTHIRFFTRKSITRMFERLDYRVEEMIGLNPRRMGPGLRMFDAVSGGLLEDTQYPQFLCKAVPCCQSKEDR